MNLRERLSRPQLVRNKIFEHAGVDIQDMYTETINNKRYYVTPTGQKYPSITSVLSILSAKAIQEWRKRVGEEEANRVSRIAAGRGTAVHAIIERYLDNEDDFVKNAPLHVIETFNKSFRPTLENRIGKIYTQEAALYSDYLTIAGRVDCIADFDGKISVVDFKTSSRVKTRDDCQSYFMQEAAYAIMFEERTGMPIEQLVTIMSVDGEKDPLIFIENRDTWAPHLLDTIESYYKLYPST